MAKNITLSVDEEVLDAARIYAAKQKTTVNALVREYLNGFASQEKRLEGARKGLLDLIDNSKGRMEPGWKWNREEVYEDRLLPRHERPHLRRDGEGS
jgi:hypothetical protein